MFTHQTLRHSVLLALFLIACSFVAIAQTAQVTGRVVDASQAVVPGATVTITNQDTGIERVTSSNENGYFSVALLPRGKNSGAAIIQWKCSSDTNGCSRRRSSSHLKTR